MEETIERLLWAKQRRTARGARHAWASPVASRWMLGEGHMKRAVLMSLVVGWCILVNIPTAFAQQPLTVGDLLSKGATRLTKDQIQKLYTGATVSGAQAGHPENTFQNTHMPDGSVTGIAWRNGVRSGTTSGTWSMNDSGQFCYNLQNGTIRNCFYYYGLDNRVYAALNDSKIDPVYERMFSR